MIRSYEKQEHSVLLTCFIVLECNNKLGAFFQTFKKVYNQVSYIFSIRTLKCEFFRSYCGECKCLCKGLATPKKRKDKIMI